MAEENTAKTEQEEQPKKNDFKPKHRVIVPTMVRFDIPIPDDLPDSEKVSYARKRVEKIVTALNKKKDGVRVESEFMTQFRKIK